MARFIEDELESYLLYKTLAPETVAWYRRAVSVYAHWATSCEPLPADFNGAEISRFLLAISESGGSPHYQKSLRGALVALLRFIRGNTPIEKVRSIKVPKLIPEGWDESEVDRLLSPGCDGLPETTRFRWRLCISLAYYTGLDRCDLERLEQTNFAKNGAIIYRRRKTGAAPSGGVPLDVLELIRTRCPRKGSICRMGVSKEWFRRIFAGIVARAGLFGTFKKLRKSSGSLVEADNPGTGHKHLGNTRHVFEEFYEVPRLTRRTPTMPKRISLPS